MKPTYIKQSSWLKYNALFFMEHLLGYKKMLKYFGKIREKLFNEIHQQMEGISVPTQFDIQYFKETDDINRISFDYTKPAVFKGVAKNWDCINKWTFEYFKKNYGDYKIILNDNKGLIETEQRQEYEEILLKDYIELCEQGTKKYLKFSRLVDENPELKNDLNLQWLRNFRYPNSRREETYMFIGVKETVTPLHVGFSANFFTQIYGKKKWIFYPANNRLFLDCRTDRTFYYYSEANPHKIDVDKFPLQQYGQKCEVEIETGDILYVPPFVWHQVENPTNSIGLAYRFTSVKLAMQSSKMLTMGIFLATNPNPITHFLTTTFKNQAYIYTRKTNKD